MKKYTFMVNNYKILNVQANSNKEAEINLKKLYGDTINYVLLAVNRNLYKVEGGRFVTYNVGEEPSYLTDTHLN